MPLRISAGDASVRPRLRRWPWVLTALVLGVTIGLLCGSVEPWAWVFGGGYRKFIVLTVLLGTTLLSSEIARSWHEKQLLLANLWLAFGATQIRVDQLGAALSSRVLVALAAVSWLTLLVAALRRARTLARSCVWLCGGFLASAALFH